MADIIDSILLRILVDPNLAAKGSELTWIELDTNLKIIRDRLALLSTATVDGFAPYNNGTIYSNTAPDYVVYNGNIYEYINVTPTAGQQPDTSPLYWSLSSTGQFTHQKDRDTYLAFGTSDQVSAEDIRALLDAYPTGISDIYIAIGERVLKTNTPTALTSGADIDLTEEVHTLTTALSAITFTISNTSDNTLIEITLNATTSTLTFPVTAKCVTEGVETGDNTLSISGTSGDVYIVSIKKIGSNYYVIAKRF